MKYAFIRLPCVINNVELMYVCLSSYPPSHVPFTYSVTSPNTLQPSHHSLCHSHSFSFSITHLQLSRIDDVTNQNLPDSTLSVVSFLSEKLYLVYLGTYQLSFFYDSSIEGTAFRPCDS